MSKTPPISYYEATSAVRREAKKSAKGTPLSRLLRGCFSLAVHSAFDSSPSSCENS